MKKINKILMFMLLVIVPIKVNAFTGSISVNCTPSKVAVDEVVSCKITGSADEKISSIEMKFSQGDNVTVQSFTPASGWSGDDVNNNLIEIYGNEVSDTFDIGTLKFKVNSGAKSGENTISFSNVVFYGVDDNENGYTVNDASAKFTITDSSEEVVKGLKSLDVINGVLGPVFNKNETSYTITLSEKTFGINAVAANSGDKLLYTTEKNGQTVTLNPTNISYSDTNDQGMMSIKLLVGSGDNAVQYKFIVVPPASTQTGSATLSTLTVGGKNVSLSSEKFEYTVTLDDVSSYQVKATLSDSKNFEFDSFLVPPVTMSGENEFIIKVNPKDSSLGVSSKTYTITVKKKSSAGSGTTGGNTSGGNNVTNNPQTSEAPAFVMAFVLIISLFASISLYKKNLNGYN